MQARRKGGGWCEARTRGSPRQLAVLDRVETPFELVETVAQQRDLGFEADRPLDAALEARRARGPFDHGVERHETLRSVRAVDQPGRDLTRAIPRAQRRAGHAGFGLGAPEGDPADVVELAEEVELGLPLDEPTVPVGSD